LAAREEGFSDDGALPMDVLEAKIGPWIESRQATD
jgi:hypothetical protein